MEGDASNDWIWMGMEWASFLLMRNCN
uniref:Uncharacterized protein n=1 Tax=Rhizophora mucronata TaxID=61149 RepID=A0A2P2P3A8_RHIMU